MTWGTGVEREMTTKNGAGWPRGKLSSTAVIFSSMHRFGSCSFQSQIFSYLSLIGACTAFCTQFLLLPSPTYFPFLLFCASKDQLKGQGEQPRVGGLFSGLCKATNLTPLLLVYLVLI